MESDLDRHFRALVHRRVDFDRNFAELVRTYGLGTFEMDDVDNIDLRDPSTWPNTGTAVLAWYRDLYRKRECELLHGVSPYPKHKSYKEFDAGTVSTSQNKGKPCEPRFLDAISQELRALLMRLSFCKFSIHSSIDSPMPADAVEVMKKLNPIFDQCRRLKASPELFPTAKAREEFMEVMKITANGVAKFSRAITAACDSNLEMEERRMREKKLAEDLPYFHPGRSDGKHPWNRWLGNSAAIGPTNWVGIQQRIPVIGDNIIRRITSLYNAYERQFEREGLLDNEVNDTLDPFRCPGEPVKHMHWGHYQTVSLHHVKFPAADSRVIHDKNNIITIEELARKHQGQSCVVIVEGDENIPYFRFAMAYDISRHFSDVL